jgi:hypothetical protein
MDRLKPPASPPVSFFPGSPNRLSISCFEFSISISIKNKYTKRTKLMQCNTRLSVTVAERSKACTVFARSEAGTVGSNLNQGMDV